MPRSYFFCGVGGSGMSALASILLSNKCKVSGSDRSYDRGETPDKFKALKDIGVTLFPQDGSGIDETVDVLVVSSAVEDSIPDIKAAKEQNITIKKRAEILAELFNSSRGIAVGGTSGKTTVTGMIGHVLQALEYDPTIVNGGVMLNSGGNAVSGHGGVFVAETDESDNSIALFEPAIAVLNNIALDHKSMEELGRIFGDFVAKAQEGVVLNLDDSGLAVFKNKNMLTYGIENSDADINAVNLQPGADHIIFDVDDVTVRLPVPGRYNVSNALAALGVARLMGVGVKQAAKALESFRGIRRRMEVAGRVNAITVIDDFAHNPDKIAASLQTLREFEGRLIVIFQIHGFGPAKMLRDGLVQTFTAGLSNEDILIMPEIYYAGGTADKSLSSRDIVNEITNNGKQARFFGSRKKIAAFIRQEARTGDRIVVMGARDDTLTEFAQEILKVLETEACYGT